MGTQGSRLAPVLSSAVDTRVGARGRRWLAPLVALALAAAPAAAQNDATPVPQGPWPIKTREHVDLWLHGYALLAGEDTSRVPLYRAGYADSMIVVRNRAGAYTALDSARTTLIAGLRKMPQLVGAQFFALHFGLFDELRQTVTLTTEAKGDPRRGNGRAGQAVIALGATYFPTPEALAWAGRFTSALADESQRVHHAEWLAGQRARTATLARIDSLWRARFFPALRNFVRGTQQRYGEIILSPVLEGEGRTITLDATRGPTIVVGYPDTPARASDALYALVHEAAATVAARAIRENITPRQAAAGLGDRLQSAAATRAGLLVLQTALPAEAEGYARFYLRVMRVPIPATGRAIDALIAATPLPAEIVEQMQSLIGTYYEGI